MSARTAVVTGATGGLGAAVSGELARAGYTVVLVGRSADRLEALAGRLRSSGAQVESQLADLADLSSVRRAAQELRRRHSSLHVLINNAAIFASARRPVAGGFESMYATNHLGPFLLTQLLLPALEAGAPARVLNVTAPSTTKLAFDNLQGERRFSALGAFGASKMCNLLFTFALARRVSAGKVGVHAFFPGLVKSELMREAAAPIRWGTRLFSKDPEASARELARLATAPELVGKTGLFFKPGKEIRAAAYAYDEEVQRRLWSTSEAQATSATP